eukprot:6138200-Prymnesium_polylepis.1
MHANDQRQRAWHLSDVVRVDAYRWLLAFESEVRYEHPRPDRAGSAGHAPLARHRRASLQVTQRTSTTPRDAGNRAAPAHLYDEHAGKALSVSRGRPRHGSGRAWH